MKHIFWMLTNTSFHLSFFILFHSLSSLAQEEVESQVWVFSSPAAVLNSGGKRNKEVFGMVPLSSLHSIPPLNCKCRPLYWASGRSILALCPKISFFFPQLFNKAAWLKNSNKLPLYYGFYTIPSCNHSRLMLFGIRLRVWNRRRSSAKMHSHCQQTAVLI